MEKRVPIPVWPEVLARGWFPTMTRDAGDTAAMNISTRDEFDSALQALLRSALANGVDLQGAWEYRDEQSSPDLEVLVTELAR